MLEFILKYWLEVIFSGFLAGAGIAIKYAWNQIKKNYIDVVKKNETDIKDLNAKIEQLESNIDKQFTQLKDDISDLAELNRKNDVSIIRDLLLRKMRYGLQSPNGCITLADYETVVALMERYEENGGNGEVHRLFARYEKLRICTEHDHIESFCEIDC